MAQKRYNTLPVQNEHNDIVNNISLIEVAKRFTDAQDKRRNEFGKFTEKDIL